MLCRSADFHRCIEYFYQLTAFEGQYVWKGSMCSSLVESLSLALVSDCGIVEECMGKCVEMHSYGRKYQHRWKDNVEVNHTEIIASELYPVLGHENMVLYDQIFSGAE